MAALYYVIRAPAVHAAAQKTHGKPGDRWENVTGGRSEAGWAGLLGEGSTAANRRGEGRTDGV